MCDGEIAYLGPAGSFTHEAAAEFFCRKRQLTPMDREKLFAAYRTNAVSCACVPVATSIVGVVGVYMDEILKLEKVVIVGENNKFISYSLLGKNGALFDHVKTVVSHPVALEEAGSWLRRFLPDAVLETAVSTSAAAKLVSERASLETAALGTQMAAELYALEILASDIEKGPHNVTRFWMLGRKVPPPTGRDKTTFAASLTDEGFDEMSMRFKTHDVRILNIYERPAGEAPGKRFYVFDVEGHLEEPHLADFLAGFPGFKVLGSYPCNSPEPGASAPLMGSGSS